jgi:hypothetical protein
MEVTAHLTHGVGLYLYIADEDVSVGSSWSTHLLLQTLDYVKQACARKGTRMPEHFHLQCDNTSRELKNSLAMKMVACLIQQKFFLTGAVELLRVGHTHEDVGAHMFKQCRCRVVGIISQLTDTSTQRCYIGIHDDIGLTA